MARPRLVSDDQILATMRKSVLAHGPSVPLDAVANELGVTGPALLKRFGSRQALFVKALLPRGQSAWLQSLEAGPDDRPIEVQLESHFIEVAEFFGEMIPCMAALRQAGLTHKEMHRYRQGGPTKGRDTFARWLTRARDQGLVETEAPEMVATAMLGAVWSQLFIAHLQMKPWSARDQHPYFRELARIFDRALRPELRGPSPSRKTRGRHV
jgi:AcrR family transcriptional regulator